MKIPLSLLKALQNRLKTGNRRAVHLNAAIAPKRPGQKIDLHRLNTLQEGTAETFLDELLTQEKLNFRISWNDLLPPRQQQTEEQEHSANQLAKSFTAINRLAKGFEEDTGINNFAFGYPLVVMNSEQDGKPFIAPLLIWSLEIRQLKAHRTWVLTRREEFPVSVNEVFANRLESDSGANLRRDELGELRDGLVTKADLDTFVRTAAMQLIPGFTAGAAPFSASAHYPFTSVRAKDYYERLLKKNDGVPQIINAGLFALFATQKQNLIRDYDVLIEQAEELEFSQGDFAGMSYEDLTSVPTDPSQQDVLTGLRDKTNLIIQGPPGTGKSQTLTATLTNALLSGKRTLVVCEKRTALDILHESLNKLGYGDLCGHIMDASKNRRDVVDSVRKRYEELGAGGSPQTSHAARLNNTLDEYRAAISKINKGHQRLANPLSNGESWTPTVGRLLQNGKEVAFNSPLFLTADKLTFEANERRKLETSLRKGEGRWRRFCVGGKEQWKEARLAKFDTVEAAEIALNTEVRDLQQHARTLDRLAAAARASLHENEARKTTETLSALGVGATKLLTLTREFTGHPDFYNDEKTDSWWYPVLAVFSGKKKKILETQVAMKRIYEQLRGDARVGQVAAKLPAATSTRGIQEATESLVAELPQLRTDQLMVTAGRVDEIDLYTYGGPETQELRKSILEARHLLNGFDWETNPAEINLQDIAGSINTLAERMQTRDPDLFEASYKWFEYKRHVDPILFDLLLQLRELTDWPRHFNTAYYGQLLSRSHAPGFPKNDISVNAIDRLEASMKGDQQRVTIDYWLKRQREAVWAFGVDNPGLSVPGLYMKRSSQKNKKKSLRAIIDYDWELFTSFFPIILTVPDVASQLFQDSRGRFDLVVFDEASQLRLEDTLPALLKAKQRIVAGDEHQMPPSNFFLSATSAGEGEDEDEEEVDDEPKKITNIDGAEDCESLLQFGEMMNFEKQYLDFHYRSRHPYLIDFSNQAFYGGRLIPQPNTQEYTPISFVPVNGRYANQQNQQEAKEVVEIISKRIQQFEGGAWPSVGVATFNLRQTNLILDYIDEKRQEDEAFDIKMTALEENADKFFVKNLENIQGDERDVIILSTTAGKRDKGWSMGSLGRLNYGKGYKLLNVIITRAKYKIYVCTSIPEELYRNYKEALAAYGANKRGALFSYLAYAKAVSDGDETKRSQILKDVGDAAQGSPANSAQIMGGLESVFEEEVYQLLAGRIGGEYLTLQEQCGGFRIDMVYHQPGRLKIAIECDGAKYHSSRQAYLYDRARQRVLEGQGYVFHRIWSTNFWRHPEREINKLVGFINENSGPEKVDANNRPYAEIFQPHQSDRRYKAIKSAPISAGSAGSSKTVTAPAARPKAYANSFVKMNVPVSVFYPGDGTRKRIRIVDYVRPQAGLQEINVRSEIARLLLGKSVGDSVMLRNGSMVTVEEIGVP